MKRKKKRKKVRMFDHRLREIVKHSKKNESVKCFQENDEPQCDVP